MTSNFPPRRHHERYACRLPVHVKVQGQSRAIDGEVINISMGGAFLRLRGQVAAGSAVQLEVEFGGEKMVLKGSVVRAAGKDPKNPGAELYGTSFQVDERTQSRIRAMIDHVRTSPGMASEFKTKDYWNL